MRLLRTSRSCGQRGTSLVETMLTVTIVFTLIFSIFEMAWLVYTYTVLSDAAHEGVRYAIVHSGGDSSGTQTRVSTFAALSMHNVNVISTSVTFPDGSSTPPNRVRVTVTYPFVPFLSAYGATPTMHAYAEGTMIAK